MSFNHDGTVREKWPVLIYRLQSHRGWEVYCDPDAERMAAASSSSSNSSSSSSLGKKQSSTPATHSTSNGRRSFKTNDFGKKSGTRNNSSNDNTDVEELTAAPREGCIEVRKMRLRIRLFAQHKPWESTPTASTSSSSIFKCGSSNTSTQKRRGNHASMSKQESVEPGVEVGTVDKTCNKNKGADDDDDDDDDNGYDTDTPGPDGWNNNALLVRRRNTLLVTTRRGWGALVFQFKSVRDCIDFCDRLVYLNRNLLMPPQLPPEASSRTRRSENGEEADEQTILRKRKFINGMDEREQYIAELNSSKRCKLDLLGDLKVCAPKYDTSLPRLPNSNSSRFESGAISNNDNTRMNETKAPEISEERNMSQVQHRQESIMNYIVQLAHSEEFRGFVDELERGLISSVGGVGSWAALGF
jgi:hypothetical protein